MAAAEIAYTGCNAGEHERNRMANGGQAEWGEIFDFRLFVQKNMKKCTIRVDKDS